MRIAFSPYALHGKHSRGIREGALIRIESEHGVGYADCHPWEEFGDLPLKAQIQALREGASTPLLKQTLYCASIDAQARKESRSLFSDVKLPPSHLLIARSDIPSLEVIAEQGISLLKMKARPGDQQFLNGLLPLLKNYGMKCRLDFNAQFTVDSCQEFLQEITSCLSAIDLIEDPCPYHEQNWQKLQTQFGVPLACDFEVPEGNHPFILVHKPCTRPLPQPIPTRVIVTSSLGHPVGQLMAAYFAARLPQAQNEVGGFLSHVMYEPNPFSQELIIKGSRLLPVDGTGLGFNSLLEQQTWISIGNR